MKVTAFIRKTSAKNNVTDLFPCPGYWRSRYKSGKRAFHQPQSLERGETGLQATCGSGIGREADEL